MEKTIAVINPLSSARYLHEELKRHGVKSIAVFTKSKDKIEIYVCPPADLFDLQIWLDDATAEDIVKVLSPYQLSYIINGSEDVTHLTDLVTTQLLPQLANDPQTSQLRCNKYYTQEAIRKAGMPAIQQRKFAADKISLSTFDGMEFPCYCKPATGTGTIGAFKAHSAAEAVEKIKKYLQEIVAFKTDEYLLQEYINGKEYAVDTFSYHGQHYLSSIYQYAKSLMDNVPIYRYFEIIHDPNIWSEASQFVKKCLDIVQFKNGFCHSELFITPTSELRLIETNPRISGGMGFPAKVTQMMQLKSQTDLLFESLDGTIRESLLDHKSGYARGLFLYNFYDHPLQDPGAQLAQFASVKNYKLVTPLGTLPSSPVKNLWDLNLLVILAHDDYSVLEHDSKAIFELERTGQLL